MGLQREIVKIGSKIIILRLYKIDLQGHLLSHQPPEILYCIHVSCSQRFPGQNTTMGSPFDEWWLIDQRIYEKRAIVPNDTLGLIVERMCFLHTNWMMRAAESRSWCLMSCLCDQIIAGRWWGVATNQLLKISNNIVSYLSVKSFACVRRRCDTKNKPKRVDIIHPALPITVCGE